MTVADLKKALEGASDNMPVYINVSKPYQMFKVADAREAHLPGLSPVFIMVEAGEEFDW